MPRATVNLRDEQVEVDIHSYSVDHSVNAVELDWSFVGLTDAGLLLLKVTDFEKELIEEQLIEFMEDYYKHDDDYYRDN